jgi:hypothetical protein
MVSFRMLRKQNDRVPKESVLRWSVLSLAFILVTLPGCGSATGKGNISDSTYDIEIRYVTEPSSSQQAIFDDAEDRWESIIIGDLADVEVSVAGDYCGGDEPAIAETIDDIIIWVDVSAIDGAGGILGSAGPCLVRNADSLTITGLMRFDSADIDDMETNGTLDEVILHEMGHVLGIGTLWDDFDFLSFAGNSVFCSSVTAFTTDPTFTGPLGIAEYNNLGGVGDVPVEEGGGSGTKCAHIDEGVFDQELMTGYIESVETTMPLSLLTVEMLEDLGYAVDDSEADTYSMPPLRASTVEINSANLDTHLSEGTWEEILLPQAAVGPNGTLQQINER